MAKTIRDEDLILNIIVKGEKGISAIDKVTVSTTRLNMSMNELSKHIKLTKTALANAVPGTENWKRLNKELQESKSRMKELQDQSKATGGGVAVERVPPQGELLFQGGHHLERDRPPCLHLPYPVDLDTEPFEPPCLGVLGVIRDVPFFPLGQSRGHVIHVRAGFEKRHFFFFAQLRQGVVQRGKRLFRFCPVF